jgi:hypothetical protein
LEALDSRVQQAPPDSLDSLDQKVR